MVFGVKESEESKKSDDVLFKELCCKTLGFEKCEETEIKRTGLRKVKFPKSGEENEKNKKENDAANKEENAEKQTAPTDKPNKVKVVSRPIKVCFTAL